MPSEARTRDVEAGLRALHENYALSLPGKIEALKVEWLRWLADPTPERLSELARQAHTLAGSGATFGYPAISATARRLETCFNRLTPAQPAAESQREAIEHAIRELGVTAQDRPPFPDKVPASPTVPVRPGIPREAVVWLVDLEPDTCARLAQRLEPYGYDTQRIPAEGIGPNLGRTAPIAILAGIGPNANDGAGIRALREWHEALAHHPPPVIFLARSDDIRARLAAARAGGAACLVDPADLDSLPDRLHELTDRSPAAPYRVLIVDDDEYAAYHHALILIRAKMETRILADPLDILSAAAEFKPELILLDVRLPGCSGMELAHVIRQHAHFAGVAIVFHSAEPDAKRRLDAVRMGGDDFLSEPMDAEHLVATVEAHALRARRYDALMYKDRLTGLLNHATYMDLLEREVARAQRHGLTLSLGFAELDACAQINDAHGHLVGDRVLSTLARVLRTRLRRTDIAGRYDGGRIAILMPETPVDAARTVIENTRAAFAALRHSLPDGEHGNFGATFSAGLAEFPACTSMDMLLQTADRALRRAKKLGDDIEPNGGA
ncbi:diguanylate cyclase [Methylococcus sp. EFPC2]|uniref:diguanylate cyclase n=1 Tax=Methylococcus sp. EFPC2 TaxID=2812648 RepID=UPI001968415E|nr:diguanylate cyclase [Methylococcus sp. EFPC2]QSA95662.1 diguanylate cyclase [Methylococcus sp. EFPC2]